VSAVPPVTAAPASNHCPLGRRVCSIDVLTAPDSASLLLTRPAGSTMPFAGLHRRIGAHWLAAGMTDISCTTDEWRVTLGKRRDRQKPLGFVGAGELVSARGTARQRF